MKKVNKYIIIIILCNLYRLITFIPNNDPIMGAMLPFAKKDNGLSAGLFAFITMFSFDVITNRLGIWTLITATTYGVLGILFSYIYRNRKIITLTRYLSSGVLGVLIFDFITGPIMSSFLFHVSFMTSLIGQIPFTIMHLISVSAFIIVITPLLDKHLINDISIVKNVNLVTSKVNKETI